LVMDGFRNPQYTGQPLGNIMFPGGYIQGMPQMAQMGVPHQMMPGPGDGRTVPQMALMPQAPPQRKDAKPKVMCTHPGCGKEFAWQQDLAKHVRKYHSGEEPRFACTHEGCGKKFYERKLLVAHERTHTDERPFACTFPGCDKRFRARNALAYHLKALHNSGDTLRCDVEGCRFTTRKREALAAHKLRHQQREAEKNWKAQAKGEVQAAVRGVKDELKNKTAELARAQRALTQEQRAHAKVVKELAALKASHARLKRRASTAASEIDRLRPLKRARGGVGHPGTGGVGAAAVGMISGDADADDAAAQAHRARPPEVVLLDGPDGKLPMLAVGGPAERLGGGGAMTGVAGGGALTGGGAMDPTGAAHPGSIAMNVNGTMRRLQPVCAQALPWSTSFIGCPGIKCDDGHDFTELFLEDGSRNAGNRRTTPLEVEHPKDVAAFHARSTNCPWAKPNLQVTLEKASDPMALHALLNDIAPKKPLKVKRVDGQCEACYAAHVALAARLRAKHNPKSKGGAAADADA
jgi:hypothetical protein